MFELFYQKNDNSALFTTFKENGMNHIQNYIPLYKKFFNLQPKNYQSINLNQHYNITSIEQTGDRNKFNCTIKSDDNEIKTTTFFKFSPLLDPVKYMIGKYGKLSDDIKTALPKLEDNTCHEKVLDSNNSAYVDGFFTYLTSNLLHTHNFIHGVDFFGSFLGIHDNFELDILDDIEYLNDSLFFHEHRNKLFNVNLTNEELFIESNSRNYKKKLKIADAVGETDILTLDDKIFEGMFVESPKNDEETEKEIRVEYHSDNKKSETKKTNDSRCSSRSSYTSNEDENADEEDGEEDSDASSMTSSLDSQIMCNATIPNFPVQIICLEAMSNTLDSLLEANLSIDEWRSCLFQIIMTLLVYQKMFGFTHNDLHTNNIMFNPTDLQYIVYKYNNTYYKVPTYGRLFKIIDFGRAIYKFRGKTICSDSFHPKGDAATQYNCEPYFNSKKPRLDANFSFDLCRLACSLYDYFLDTLEDAFDSHPIASLIDEWCTDDKGRNILYKTCGEERYPDFKLYKMIARTVHNHRPDKYIDHMVFKRFTSSRKKCKKKKVMNIDDLPSYV